MEKPSSVLGASTSTASAATDVTHLQRTDGSSQVGSEESTYNRDTSVKCCPNNNNKERCEQVQTVAVREGERRRSEGTAIDIGCA